MAQRDNILDRLSISKSATAPARQLPNDYASDALEYADILFSNMTGLEL